MTKLKCVCLLALGGDPCAFSACLFLSGMIDENRLNGDPRECEVREDSETDESYQSFRLFRYFSVPRAPA